MRGDESERARIDRARRGSPGKVQDSAIAQAVAQQFDNYLSQLLKDFSTIKEKVETLNGDRQDKTNAAIKVGQVTGVFEVRAEPTSRLAAAAPTMDEFNALVTDVQAVYAGINAIRTMLGR